jgi:hypothetical protein
MLTRRRLCGPDGVIFVAKAPTCVAIGWVAPVLAPLVLSAEALANRGVTITYRLLPIWRGE